MKIGSRNEPWSKGSPRGSWPLSILAALLILAASMVFASACNAEASAEAGQAETTTEQDMSVTFELDGMTCNGCVQGVQGALRRMAGVEAADVTLDPPHATVRYRGSETDVDTLRAGIEDIGYTVVSVVSPSE